MLSLVASGAAYHAYLVKLNVTFESECERRPKGRCHIMVPAGGANAEGWLAFRDVLARIESYTSRAAPAQVISGTEKGLDIRVMQGTARMHTCEALHAKHGEFKKSSMLHNITASCAAAHLVRLNASELDYAL